MRYLSLMCVLLVGLAGCGGKKPAVKVAAFEGTAVGERIVVEGTLSQRGSTPFTSLVIETDEGGVVQVESRTIEPELKSLVGMRCAVTGNVLDTGDKDRPRINATGYEILRLPSGELPVIGILSVIEGNCVLETREGARYWIRGDLVGVIQAHRGARMWIVGELQDETPPANLRAGATYWVTGFGVLDEAPNLRR